MNRKAVVDLMLAKQATLVEAFSQFEKEAEFQERSWEQPDGGGGWARILENGDVFERAGINVAAVHGKRVPPAIADREDIDHDSGYFATGVSMVVHGRNPYVPSFHANYRYFEVDGGSIWWFGGGADLTPAYVFEEDAEHFHSVLKDYCDAYDPGFYAKAKRECDEYFYIPHRDETRGVGGIFFVELHPDGAGGWNRALDFIGAGLDAIVPAYAPIVERRKDLPYSDRERAWQLTRRGRYVEFNLVYDNGTKFGLQAKGHIDSVLMSLPPMVGWNFDATPEPGSPEAAVAGYLRPRDWIPS
ncbi:oxygen-dependent coproporphyrinogen oxidase [Actinomadura darangshiensis]|uniref:coproporphyrinogen oxidase n=1 Tax=Actinomadura darangshiensis TaxID=705336 RepID=A0A4R5BW67_9ACTN|nr:oxygen-dependent coproporphyrinogen oxidase [Actinomadura darangshiensis]TDD89610.1 oxygen-dependent coproporphyrinogen oxidase [Actinomadura darangshiensis]